MLHRLCGPPSIPLSFSLATVLPRRGTYCVSSGTEMITTPTPSAHRLRRGLPGYLIPFAPHALAPQRQCLSRRPPSPLTFFLISTHFTAHQEFRLPLQHSSFEVCLARPRLSRGLSRDTVDTAYGRFTPSNSEQRLPPPSYRGCWHGVSRGLLWRYRHPHGLFTRSLRPSSQSFTPRKASSLTRRCCVRLAPIAQNSPLLPPVGVWAVSQSQCG